jgi:hypothetical protein
MGKPNKKGKALSSQQPMPVGRLVRMQSQFSAPVSADPHAGMTAMTPMAMHPHCTRMRTGCPAATRPDPTATPFPTAANPDERRVGRDGNHFNLRWRRRGVLDDDFGLRRGLLDIDWAVAINDLTLHAPCKQ